MGAGVKRGYKPKPKSVKRRRLDMVRQRAFKFNQLARELFAFLGDEIVYATIDTVRVVRYVQSEFRRTPRRPVESKINALREYETKLESGTLAAEPNGSWSIERRA